MLAAHQLIWQQNGKKIIQGIDLQLNKGERVGLLGPNGSGKSSLLKLLSFLERPTAGQLFFQDQPISQHVPLTIRRRIAVVFQEPLLMQTTVFENVAAGLKIRRVPKAEIRLRVENWLQRFGVAHLTNQHARSLSGGEAQRVSLARAFVLEPDILFLDEPFSALDAPSKEMLLNDLASILLLTQTTTVLVSHDFREIERLTQRAMILFDGQIEASGTPWELLNDPQTNRVEQFLALWKNNTNRFNFVK